eukprot:3405154-Lingulodinium_polyedra.AAC.1
MVPGQPGFDHPELGWVGDIVFRRMHSIKEQWLLSEKANNVDHRGHRYYSPFPVRQVPPPIQKEGYGLPRGGSWTRRRLRRRKPASQPKVGSQRWRC